LKFSIFVNFLHIDRDQRVEQDGEGMSFFLSSGLKQVVLVIFEKTLQVFCKV